MNYAKIFTLLGLVCCSLSAKSQEVTIKPIPYPLDQFLTNIVGMCQDEDGFIWLADNYNGLVRYDGTHKKYYKSNPGNPNSLSSNRLETVAAGKDGIIWVGTAFNGLDRLDTRTETFTNFNPKSEGPSSSPKINITALLEDSQGTLWVGTAKGLDTLDRKLGTLVPILDPSPAGLSLAEVMIRKVYEDKEGNIWIGTGNFFGGDVKSPNDGLYLINTKTSQISRYTHDPADPTSLIDNRIKAIFEDSRGNFWIGSAGDGLHLMDRTTGTFTRFGYDKAKPSGLSRPPVNPNANYAIDHITFINEDSQGSLWIGTYAGGINRYNPMTQQVEFYGKSEDPGRNLGKNDFWTLLKTADGLLWIAGWEPTTENEVLYQLSTFSEKLDYTSINKRAISFAEDSNGGVWIGSEKGLEGYQIAKSETDFFLFVQNSLGQKRIGNLKFDYSGNLWVATFTGLYHFDRDSMKETHFESKKPDPASLGSNFVLSILPDLDGKVWIGTAAGLDLLDTKTGIFTHYQHIPKDTNSLVSNTVSTVFKDSRGKIWVGTDKGLNQFEPKTGDFQRKLIEYSAIVNSVHEDNKGRIWVSTYRSGLFLSDEQGENFGIYQDETGLITNDLLVKSMVGDDENQLWLNTDVGFIKLNPETGVALLFGNSLKRIVENNFNSQKTLLSSQGELFTGDVSGFYHFSLERLQKEYRAKPQLYWTRFFIGDLEAIPGENKVLPLRLSQTKKITLPYNQNSITFEFGDIDFVTEESEKNILYKLENFDSKWIKVNQDKKIYFNNLPPGEYVLRVKSANRFGNVGEQSISIQILAPWFVRWWAWLGYLLLLSGILFSIYSFLLRRKLAQAEVNRLQELDQFKTRLYTNLTHEFRTPLTVISGIADQVSEHPKVELQERIAMIKRNSQQLLGLINQMLDLAKLESGTLPVKMVQDDIIQYFRYLSESYHSYAESKEIRLHLLTDRDEIVMDFDPEKIQTIFTNLVGNAIKFTPVGGDIYLEVQLEEPKTGEKHLSLKVKDTGKGIAESALPYIFDRFYQEDNSSTRTFEGTGIGLSLTAELVTLLGGSITVKSQEGKGTEFSVRLPASQNAKKEKASGKLESKSQVPVLEKEGISIQEDLFADDLPLALLIEDHEDVLRYLVSCLKGQYRLLLARNGRDGIELAIDQVPDIIISDVMMPLKDGYEVVETLKKDERTSHIPIILLTAKADLDSRLEGLERGADAYLSKPFEKKELEVRLRKLIEVRKTIQRHYRDSILRSQIPPAPNTQVEAEELRVPEKPERTSQTSALRTDSLDHRFVLKVRGIIEHHLDHSDFDVESLCRELALSNSQVHRKLVALTGLSATHFIRYVRLVQAKELLKKSWLTVSSIAHDCGFADPAYFSRIFKKEFGLSPQEWREQNLM